MPKKYRIVAKKTSSDGYIYESLESVYPLDKIRRRNPQFTNTICGLPIRYDWRDRIRSGENIVRSCYIPTDDDKYAIRVVNQINCNGTAIIETVFGTFDFEQDIRPIDDLGWEGESFDWLEDDSRKRLFAQAWVMTFGNYVRAIQIAYERQVNPKYYKKIFKLLREDEVVVEEIRQDLRKAYKENSISLITLIKKRKELLAELEDTSGIKAMEFRDKLVDKMIDDFGKLSDAGAGDGSGTLEDGQTALAGLLGDMPEMVDALKEATQRAKVAALPEIGNVHN